MTKMKAVHHLYFRGWDERGRARMGSYRDDSTTDAEYILDIQAINDIKRNQPSEYHAYVGPVAEDLT